MLFSQRRGLKPIKDVIQIDTVDQDLRNGLWTAVTIWRSRQEYVDITNFVNLMKRFWLHYLKNALDTFPNPNDLFSKMRKLFFDAD
jgi:hypothetical protein